MLPLLRPELDKSESKRQCSRAALTWMIQPTANLAVIPKACAQIKKGTRLSIHKRNMRFGLVRNIIFDRSRLSPQHLSNKPLSNMVAVQHRGCRAQAAQIAVRQKRDQQQRIVPADAPLSSLGRCIRRHPLSGDLPPILQFCLKVMWRFISVRNTEGLGHIRFRRWSDQQNLWLPLVHLRRRQNLHIVRTDETN